MILVESCGENQSQPMNPHQKNKNENQLKNGTRSTQLIPVQRAGAHEAEVCAEHLDTQLETLPVLPDYPTRSNVQKEKGETENSLINRFRQFVSGSSGHTSRHDHSFDLTLSTNQSRFTNQF